MQGSAVVARLAHNQKDVVCKSHPCTQFDESKLEDYFLQKAFQHKLVHRF